MLFIYCIYAMEKETIEEPFLYYKSTIYRDIWNLEKQHQFKGKKLCMSMIMCFSAGIGASSGETTADNDDQLVKVALQKRAMHRAGDESRERVSTVGQDVVTEANLRVSFQGCLRVYLQDGPRGSSQASLLASSQERSEASLQAC